MNKINSILTIGVFAALSVFNFVPSVFAATTGGYDCFRPDGSTYNSGTYEEGDPDKSHNPPYWNAGDPVLCSVAGRVAIESGFDLKDTFGWIIGIGSLVALGVITFGGVRYASSGFFGSHSSDAISHAKAWIFGGLKGLGLLIAAYLILNTINPTILLF